MQWALDEHSHSIFRQVEQRRLALLLDYDGTLTPIVRRPEEAVLSDEMRSLLRELAPRCTVAVISGRDRRDVEKMVGVESLIYAGSHGYDVEGPDIRMEHEQARDALPQLDEAEAALRRRLDSVPGARIERKRFAIAVHYREVDKDEDVARIERAVDDAGHRHGSLRKMSGKKIFELQPDVPWNKGQAVLWLIRQLDLDRPGVIVIYIGDDVTDEDAFRVLRPRETGMGIRVTDRPSSGSEASHYLRDCEEVREFLASLLSALGSG